MVTQVTNAIRSRTSSNPKTVLGFYATVAGLLLAGAVGVAGILARYDVQTDLIPWILGFAAVVVLLLLVGVFVVTLIDPSKLMLTQVSGSEYAVIQQRQIVGDSLTGERVRLVGSVPAVEDVELLAPSPRELPSTPDDGAAV